MNSLNEAYAYDELNRLTTVTLPSSGTTENSYTYDVLGNMLTKADVGTYTYKPAQSSQRHGVQSINYTTGGSTSFSYNGNGEVTAGAGRTLAWTIFDEVANAGYAGRAIAPPNAADHSQVMPVASRGRAEHLPHGQIYGPTPNSFAKSPCAAQRFRRGLGSGFAPQRLLSPSSRVASGPLPQRSLVNDRFRAWSRNGPLKRRHDRLVSIRPMLGNSALAGKMSLRHPTAMSLPAKKRRGWVHSS